MALMMSALALSVLLASPSLELARGPAAAQPRETEPPVQGVRDGLGQRCIPYGETQSTGPVIYHVADIGRRGVPVLTPSQKRSISAITRYLKSPHLRFVLLDRQFVVFNAFRGPCVYDAPGYQVLNGFCNEYYQPGRDPDHTHPVAGCIGPPRPWAPADRGLPGDPNFWRDPNH
jgi:hypothetical protein